MPPVEMSDEERNALARLGVLRPSGTVDKLALSKACLRQFIQSHVVPENTEESKARYGVTKSAFCIEMCGIYTELLANYCWDACAPGHSSNMQLLLNQLPRDEQGRKLTIVFEHIYRYVTVNGDQSDRQGVWIRYIAKETSIIRRRVMKRANDRLMSTGLSTDKTFVMVEDHNPELVEEVAALRINGPAELARLMAPRGSNGTATHDDDDDEDDD